MRAPNDKKPMVTKAPKAIQGGPLVRLPSKKLFCPKCLRLVKGKVQNSGVNTQLSCPRCATRLRVWTITSWKSAAPGTTN